MTTLSKNRQGNEKIFFHFISKESITKAFEGQKKKQQQEKKRIHGTKGKRSSKEARLPLTSNSRFQPLSGIALSSQLLLVSSFLIASPDTFGETIDFRPPILKASSSELQTPLLHP